MKIAFVYIDSVGDAGWTFSHDTARKALEAEFGDKIQTSIVDKVPEGADAERVVRDFTTQGNGLIIGTSFGYMEPMMKVLKNSPTSKFEHATGYKRSDNMHLHLRCAHLRRRIHGWRSGRQNDQNNKSFSILLYI